VRARSPIGTFSFHSLQAIRWASYNAIGLLVRYTCVNFIRVTPFLSLFHRMMGMRIGQRVLINTAIIADSNLIDIGDDTLIGGDAQVVAHAAERGMLVTAPIKIGKRVTIGLMAVVFPGRHDRRRCGDCRVRGAAERRDSRPRRDLGRRPGQEDR
jgi:acetyltransferase-like isoleucine patch superfamily enzyme